MKYKIQQNILYVQTEIHACIIKTPKYLSPCARILRGGRLRRQTQTASYIMINRESTSKFVLVLHVSSIQQLSRSGL